MAVTTLSFPSPRDTRRIQPWRELVYSSTKMCPAWKKNGISGVFFPSFWALFFCLFPGCFFLNHIFWLIFILVAIKTRQPQSVIKSTPHPRLLVLSARVDTLWWQTKWDSKLSFVIKDAKTNDVDKVSQEALCAIVLVPFVSACICCCCDTKGN